MKFSASSLVTGSLPIAMLLATTVPLTMLSASPALAQERMPTVGADPTVDLVDNGHGRINYAAGVVKATGYGAPPPHANTPVQAKLMALGAARADALRTLAMAVSEIQVTASTKVKNYQLQNDTVETQISTLVDSPRVVSESFQPDGTAVVIVDLPMYGPDSIAAAVLPQVLPSTPTAAPSAPPSDNAPASTASTAQTAHTPTAPAYSPPLTVAPASGNLPNGAGADANGNFVGPPEPATPIVPLARTDFDRAQSVGSFHEPGVTSQEDNGPFTAVIVDCRGLDIDSIMSPKLMDTSGREVYGTVHVSADYAIDTGIVGYPRSMREALHTARAGTHPLIVRALRAADVHRFNPVISADDADRILAANNRDHFLEQTRVIFLVDPIR